MTKEQFDAGIGEFYDKEAITKVYALIGPREDEAYMIIDEWGNVTRSAKGAYWLPRVKPFIICPMKQ